MKADQERVKVLLTDTITQLCRNGLHFQQQLRVQVKYLSAARPVVTDFLPVQLTGQITGQLRIHPITCWLCFEVLNDPLRVELINDELCVHVMMTCQRHIQVIKDVL